MNRLTKTLGKILLASGLTASFGACTLNIYNAATNPTPKEVRLFTDIVKQLGTGLSLDDENTFIRNHYRNLRAEYEEGLKDDALQRSVQEFRINENYQNKCFAATVGFTGLASAGLCLYIIGRKK